MYIKANFTEGQSKINEYSSRKNQVVFAGRLDKLKGIELLLEAWKEIDSIELLICGEGPEYDWCETFIQDNNLSNVKLLGFLENHTVKKIVSESKAMILPTQWYEGYPMSIVESFSMGTPVVGSALGNVGCIIENGVNGWVFEHNSIKDLQEKVSNITDIVQSTEKYYRENLSREENYRRLACIYNKIRV